MNVIRLAVDEVQDFVGAVVAQQPAPLNQVNVPSVSGAWRGFIPSGTGVAYGVRHEDAPAGFMLSLFTTDLISGLPQAVEYLFMVAPQHRAGGTARKLMDAFEFDALQRGCKTVVCGCNQVFKPKVMRRFYLQQGYKPFSEAFSKTIKES